MCDCIHKLEEQCRDKYGDPDGYLDATVGIIMPSIAIVRYYSRTRYKNGNLSKGRESIAVMGSYCPFCGEKYKNA